MQGVAKHSPVRSARCAPSWQKRRQTTIANCGGVLRTPRSRVRLPCAKGAGSRRLTEGLFLLSNGEGRLRKKRLFRRRRTTIPPDSPSANPPPFHKGGFCETKCAASETLRNRRLGSAIPEPEGAHEGRRQWRKQAEVSPMSKGVRQAKRWRTTITNCGGRTARKRSAMPQHRAAFRIGRCVWRRP